MANLIKISQKSVNHAHRTLHEMIAKGIIEQHSQIYRHVCAAIVALVAPVIPEFDLVVSGVRVVFAISLHEIFEESP